MANVSIIAALVAGMLSFLSPCVLPLVPPYLVYLTGTSLERFADAEGEPQVRRETLAAALLFVLGFSTVFVALGYLMGLAFALGWTPCIGPILAAILAIAASEQTVAKGAGMLAVYSLGLGVPFIIAAIAIESFAAFLARFKKHLHRVEQGMGALLVVTGVAFLFPSLNWINWFSNWLLDAFPVLSRIG